MVKKENVLGKSGKRIIAILVIFMMVVSSLPLSIHATISSHVVISEVYGGGGNAGALYTHDFIELYNPTDADVDISGWKLKYHSSSTTAINDNNVFVIPDGAFIKAKSYYLTQHSRGTGGTEALPTPDAIGALTMGAGGCAVALFTKDNEQVDLAGFNAKLFEGATAPATSNTTSGQRKDNDGSSTGSTNGWDTDNNLSDFYIGATTPRNSSYSDVVVEVEPVTSSIATSNTNPTAIPLNQTITLSTATAGATISYTLNDHVLVETDLSEVTITVDAFNQEGSTAKIIAYASKSGEQSVNSQFIYKQASVDKASANPGSGKVTANTSVSLSGVTGAQLFYQVKQQVGTPNETISQLVEYTSAIQLNETMFPVEIIVTTKLANYLDNTVTFSYSLKGNLTDFNYYFGQLHSHTSDSDGTGTPTQAYDYARNNAHVDFLALTEHSNYFEAANTSTATNKTAEKWVNGRNIADQKTVNGEFVGIYAYEMTWSGGPGHMNSFNTDGFVSRQSSYYNNKTDNAGLQAYYQWLVSEQTNSISMFNHPGKTFGTFADYDYWTPEADERINLIEVGNGEGAVGSGGYFSSYTEYSKALDKGWHLAPTNGQDNHKGKWGDANTARTVVLASSLTRDDLFEAMNERRVYATEDNNLEIDYRLNGEVMGSILSASPEKINVTASINDPDSGDVIKSISLVTSGGKEIGTQSFSSNQVNYHLEVNNDYPYYYLKLVQEDGDIAVTAPIWTSQVEKTGISYLESDELIAVTNQEFKISAELYNDETLPFNITNVSLTADGQSIYEQTSGVVSKGQPLVISTMYQSTKARYVNFELIVEGTMNGITKTFTKQLSVMIEDASQFAIIAIDASHQNEYVAGNYANSMNNFGKLAIENGARTIEIKNGITPESLAGVSLLILTPPSRKNSGGLTLQAYTDTEIQVIKEYVQNGGSIIVLGLADYGDYRTNAIFHTAYQQNRVLEAIGSSAKIVDDQVIDNVNNAGQAYRLRFNTYNNDSNYLKGVLAAQEYSFYSGSYVEVLDATKVTSLVSSHTTTQSSDADNDGKGGLNNPIANGSSPVLTVETLSNGARIFVGGSVFMSNFEVQATLDNYGDLPYSNYTISKNIIDSITNGISFSTIKEVWDANEYDVFTIEGTATSNASGYDKETAFFDSIYIQDDTAGINLFPVAGNIQEGQKLRVKGYVSGYNGEKQLNVTSISIIDPTINKVAPTEVAPSSAMLPENVGKLLKVSGQVSDIVYDDGGVIESFVLDHNAKVFIDGYITKDYDLTFIEEGKCLTIVGLGSISTEGPRIRIRNRADITIDTFNQMKLDAIESLKVKAQEYITMIESLPGLTIKQKTDALEELNTILEQGIELVQNAQTTETIESSKNAALTSMDQHVSSLVDINNQVIAKAKETIEHKAMEVKSMIEGFSYLTNEEKQALIEKVNTDVENAKTLIQSAANAEAIETLVTTCTSGLDVMVQNTELLNAQKGAVLEIEEKIKTMKTIIEKMPILTLEEKQKTLEHIENEHQKGITAINLATTLEMVEKEKRSTLAALDTVLDTPFIQVPQYTEIKLNDGVDLLKGVIAYDLRDGDLISKVSVQGAVDKTKSGIYTVTYTVKNKAGKTTTATQVFIVNDGYFAIDHGYILTARDFTLKDTELNTNDAGLLKLAQVKVYDMTQLKWIDNPTVSIDRSQVNAKEGTYAITFKFNPSLTVKLTVKKSSNLPETGNATTLISMSMVMIGIGGVFVLLDKKRKLK